jgi:hypothetical protein
MRSWHLNLPDNEHTIVHIEYRSLCYGEVKNAERPNVATGIQCQSSAGPKQITRFNL